MTHCLPTVSSFPCDSNCALIFTAPTQSCLVDQFLVKIGHNRLPRLFSHNAHSFHVSSQGARTARYRRDLALLPPAVRLSYAVRHTLTDNCHYYITTSKTNPQPGHNGEYICPNLLWRDSHDRFQKNLPTCRSFLLLDSVFANSKGYLKLSSYPTFFPSKCVW